MRDGVRCCCEVELNDFGKQARVRSYDEVIVDFKLGWFSAVEGGGSRLKLRIDEVVMNLGGNSFFENFVDKSKF